jgi:hypothetical protein
VTIALLTLVLLLPVIVWFGPAAWKNTSLALCMVGIAILLDVALLRTVALGEIRTRAPGTLSWIVVIRRSERPFAFWWVVTIMGMMDALMTMAACYAVTHFLIPKI